MAGAHFVSDTVFAGVFTFLIIWVVHGLIYRWPRTRLSDEAIERALERIALARAAIASLARLRAANEIAEPGLRRGGRTQARRRVAAIAFVSNCASAVRAVLGSCRELSQEEPVAEPEDDVKRVLQIKMRALGDAGSGARADAQRGAVLPDARAAQFRVLQNVDDPAQFLVEIEYASSAALELNRHKVASDPMVRTFLQGWRTILAGSADMDVYEDVTD